MTPAAAADAATAGAPAAALWYLADAARYGGRPAARLAADALAGILPATASRLSLARAAGIRARSGGEPAELLAAAEDHLALGLPGPAAELAERAARPGADRSSLSVRAATVLAEARGRLGSWAVPAAPAVLTRRETEIARMAADGRTDREIADSLVVSVRTVESHLASAYRKLGIRSRRELAGALPAGVRTR